MHVYSKIILRKMPTSKYPVEPNEKINQGESMTQIILLRK